LKGGDISTLPLDLIVRPSIVQKPQRQSFQWIRGQSCTNYWFGSIKWS